MSSATSDSREWYCVRCQTKREHIAAGHLREIEGIEVFCPRLRYRKATRRGKIWWVEPMFPGYVLAKFTMAEMERAVMFCQGVRGLVRFGSDIPSVPESFVEAIKHEILNRKDATENELVTLSPTIELGDEVEVATGPFQGMQGTVVSVPSATERVKILLEFLGKPQAVDMDLFSILLPRRPTP
ncbi:MAG: transcription termination/antitermination NusG family protein [Luteolibacter sp.]|uniref:transcription termination/antitermination protein NusG n=1 Tax=Luteolibacter sp. TaxID=1962973 RepID=UPI003265A990